jgi:hypothetical protein
VRVRAIGEGCAGTSKWSEPATVTLPPHPPAPMPRTSIRTVLVNTPHTTPAVPVDASANQEAARWAINEQAVHAVASIAASSARSRPFKAVLPPPGHLSVRTQAGLAARTKPSGGPQRVAAAATPASQQGTSRAARPPSGLAAKSHSPRTPQKVAAASEPAQRHTAHARHCPSRNSTPMTRAPPVRAKRRARCARERIKRAMAVVVILAVVGGSALYGMWESVSKWQAPSSVRS